MWGMRGTGEVPWITISCSCLLPPGQVDPVGRARLIFKRKS